MEYAIKIDGKYFKKYVYHDKTNSDRFGGITELGTRLQDGDIVDIVLTDEIERTEVRRGLGGTIAILYGIDKIRNKKIEIIPVVEKGGTYGT